MKRKIAAILAADIAGYSRLVAEDEEETIRRLGAYRAVFDDLIARYGGRIFNTAGDAVLAEFPSSVEAVRCAVDVQESLRTRNRSFPPSRQMNFRIGITVGDVIERDGDLLGDGVNIAARLEGLAPAGGLCISHSVYDQVANKVSVQFADMGPQQVKNIPRPVHAYVLALDQPGNAATIPPQAKLAKDRRGLFWMMGATGLAAFVVGTVWLKKPATRLQAPSALSQQQQSNTPPLAPLQLEPASPVAIATPAEPPVPSQPASPPVNPVISNPPDQASTRPAPSAPTSPAPAVIALAVPAKQNEPDIAYAGTMVCDKLPFTAKSIQVAAQLTIRGANIVFSRDIYSADGKYKTGVEAGAGSLKNDGVLQVTTSWASPTSDGRLDGSYSGKFSQAGGKLGGKQIILVRGVRYERRCTINLEKSRTN